MKKHTRAFKKAWTIALTVIMTASIIVTDCPVVNYPMTFLDVPDNQWYTEAVRWAASNGIVNGYDANSFGSAEKITREQIVTILYRYAQFRDADVSSCETDNLHKYTDEKEISAWAVKAFCWAVDAGIIQGVNEKELSPKSDAARAQAAVMLMRCDTLIH